MRQENLIYNKQSGVAFITINRPDSENRINEALSQDMREVVSDISKDEDISVVVLTSVGDIFCMGDDEPLRDIQGKLSSNDLETYLKNNMVASAISSLEKPVICALNGHAISHGLELALACDIRISSNRSFFGFPGISEGSMPWDGGTQRLPRSIGLAWGMDLLLTGRLVNAKEALKIGLVHKVIPKTKVLGEAFSLANKIALMAPIATRYMKEAINKGMDLTLEQGMRLEADLNIILQTTIDRAEGINSFLERRAPLFKGE
jgi:enoyl-CoA hydratase